MIVPLITNFASMTSFRNNMPHALLSQIASLQNPTFHVTTVFTLYHTIVWDSLSHTPFHQRLSPSTTSRGNDIYHRIKVHYLSHPPPRLHCRSLLTINSLGYWLPWPSFMILFSLLHPTNIEYLKLPVEFRPEGKREMFTSQQPDVETECCWLSASPGSAVDTRRLRPEQLPRFPLQHWLAGNKMSAKTLSFSYIFIIYYWK